MTPVDNARAVRRQLPVGRLEVDPARFPDLDQVAKEQTGVWPDKLRALDPEELATTARREVEEILATDTALERFQGKRLLRALYKDLGVQSALTVPGFCLAVATHAAGSGRINRLARPAVQQVRLYFPAGLDLSPRASGGPDHEALANECEGTAPPRRVSPKAGWSRLRLRA